MSMEDLTMSSLYFRLFEIYRSNIIDYWMENATVIIQNDPTRSDYMVMMNTIQVLEEVSIAFKEVEYYCITPGLQE